MIAYIQLDAPIKVWALQNQWREVASLIAKSPNWTSAQILMQESHRLLGQIEQEVYRWFFA